MSVIESTIAALGPWSWFVLGLLLLGIVPSRISPQASWRYSFLRGPDLRLLLEDAEILAREGVLGPERILSRSTNQLDACLVGLIQDASQGIEPSGAIYAGKSAYEDIPASR